MDDIYSLNKKTCYSYLNKEGKFIYYKTNNDNQYLCVINNILLYGVNNFPNLIGRNEDTILKKLLILNYAKINDLQYIVNDDKTTIIFFTKANKDIIIKIKIFALLYENINPSEQNDIESYGRIYTILRLQTKDVHKHLILNYIFYTFYIIFIKDEIKQKYGVKLDDFPNYHELYLFLKKKGYVNIFYNEYSKIIINSYKKYIKLYNNISTHKKYDKLKIKYEKKIKNFSDLNILDIIDKNVNEKFNKKYIKEKFIELTEKI